MKIIASHILLLVAWASIYLIREEWNYIAVIPVFLLFFISDVLRISSGYKGIFFRRAIEGIDPNPTGVFYSIRILGYIVIGVSIASAIGKDNFSIFTERLFGSGGIFIGFALLHAYIIYQDRLNTRRNTDAQQVASCNH
jgi:hypothetical protein